jgi:hypothetical protein
VWFIVYVYRTDSFDYSYYFRKSSAFLLSSGIMLAAQYASPNQLWRALKIALPLWLLFAILGYASPSLYFAVVKPLIPTVIGVAGGRGTTSLAPEATDFGFTMAFMVLLVMLTRARLKAQGDRPARWPIFVAIASLILSKSGSGYGAGLVIAVLYALTGKGRSSGVRLLQWIGVGAAITIGFLVAQVAGTTNVRGLDLITLAVRSPASLLNTTLSYRIVHNVVGVLGAIDSNLLGFGSGAFLAKAPLLYEKYGLGYVFGLTGWYATNVPATLSVSPVAFFPVILMEYGVIGLIYIILVFRVVLTSRLPFRMICATMVFLTWVQSFPAAYPLLWVLLGISLNWAFQEPPAQTWQSEASSAGRRRILPSMEPSR